MTGKSSRKKILYLCTGNACRSQMAEGWTHHLKADQFEAFSAGVNPHGIDSRAIRVMAEAGVDISSQKSKHIDSLSHLEFDYVITLCDHAKEVCPIFPAKSKVVHMGFQDPPTLAANAGNEEEALDFYRQVRDAIRSFVEALPKPLDA